VKEKSKAHNVPPGERFDPPQDERRQFPPSGLGWVPEEKEDLPADRANQALDAEPPNGTEPLT